MLLVHVAHDFIIDRSLKIKTITLRHDSFINKSYQKKQKNYFSAFVET